MDLIFLFLGHELLFFGCLLCRIDVLGMYVIMFVAILSSLLKVCMLITRAFFEHIRMFVFFITISTVVQKFFLYVFN